MVAAACGHSPNNPGPIDQPPPPPPPSTPPPRLSLTRILGFGDSMTEGTTSPSLPTLSLLTPGLPASYPYKLQDLMTARYSAQTITVLNAGKAGRNARDDRDRCDGALSEGRPELLILMEGANDLNSGITDVSPVVNAMEDMVRDAMGRGSQVMLATLPPQRPAPGSKANPPALLTRYNNDLRAMAARKGAILVEVNSLFPVSLIGQDGLHPTDAGYQKLAEIFADAIKGRFETAGVSTAQFDQTRLIERPDLSRRPAVR
jgi:lysophospholipase L1-like esterase